MENSVIFEIFGKMRDAHIVRSEQEFCKVWLGRSECYMRTLRYKGRQPSIGTLAICADRLRRGSRAMICDGDKSQALLLKALSHWCNHVLNTTLPDTGQLDRPSSPLS